MDAPAILDLAIVILPVAHPFCHTRQLASTAPLHHGVAMRRLTISLDDELYAMDRAYALVNRKSISKAIGDLVRPKPNSDSSPSALSAASFSIDPVTQLPVVRWKAGKISMDDILHAQEDEDLRYLEGMGTPAGSISDPRPCPPFSPPPLRPPALSTAFTPKANS